uniref:CP12 domain-containing protein n=1 Tax=Odontella aurita TaxID=265563 RepID=A0A7S4I4P3_9STRA
MKFSTAAAVAAIGMATITVSSAFVTSPAFVTSSLPSVAGTTALFGSSRPDSSDAVKAAMEASEKFGSQSKEARLAWEAVEEVDASDNSAAVKGGINEAECLVDDPDKACEEYFEKLAELSELISEQLPKIDKVKTLAAEVKKVNLSKPESKKGGDSPAMRKALAEAKEATEEFGISSPQAKLAWESLEEIASSDLSEATKGTLDEECLVETIEACEAIEELQQVLDSEQQKVQS